jgi:hypothetical protein
VVLPKDGVALVVYGANRHVRVVAVVQVDGEFEKGSREPALVYVLACYVGSGRPI